MTKQRFLVLEIVNHAHNHLTAEEIYTAALERMPSMARATVYNNLNALTDQGAIRRVKLHGQPDRYDRVLAPHDHLICDVCGRLADVYVGDLLAELTRRMGREISSYDLNIHYICDTCQNANVDSVLSSHDTKTN